MLTDKQKRALAFYAPMWATGPMKSLSLNMYSCSQKQAKKGLKMHWDITTREELLESIEMMSNARGHMEEYMMLHRRLLSMPEEGAQEYTNRFKDDKDKFNKLLIVNTYKYELMNCGGMAYDLCRGHYLCCSGYVAGIITEEEAWDIIMKTYENFSPYFESWEQYVLSFNAGRQFWSSNISGEYVESTFKENTMELFFKKNSLFKDFLSIHS